MRECACIWVCTGTSRRTHVASGSVMVLHGPSKCRTHVRRTSMLSLRSSERGDGRSSAVGPSLGAHMGGGSPGLWLQIRFADSASESAHNVKSASRRCNSIDTHRRCNSIDTHRVCNASRRRLHPFCAMLRGVWHACLFGDLPHAPRASAGERAGGSRGRPVARRGAR